MAEWGQMALLAALMASVYSIAVFLAGDRLGSSRLKASGRYAVFGAAASLTAAVVALANLVVANYGGADAPLYIKASSLWGTESGSFLVWGWFVMLYAAVIVIHHRRTQPASTPYAIAILMGISLLFTSILVLASNPFELARARTAGFGLNPLLQDWRMFVHPPLLLLGFSGFFVPFAFTVAAVLVRDPNAAWRQTARRWALIAWVFLSAGVLIGGNWAYRRLGWGGFWAWDPVENGALMPWLVGAAYMHSIAVQEKKNMLKTWNLVLAAIACVLSVFGGFLSRTGLVVSIHGFAQSAVAGYLLAFMGVALCGTLWLIVTRRDYLRAENRIESFASREVILILNNLILLAACFAVLWGTMLPAISEWITGARIEVRAPWFNWVIAPIAAILLCLMGAGSFLEWRRTSRHSRTQVGGYIVHLGFALLFIGVAGQSFKTETQFEAKVGETFQFKNYVFKLDELGDIAGRDYSAQRASVTVFENGKPSNTIYPERRFYRDGGARRLVTEVALWQRPKEDLYLVFAGPSANGDRAVFLAFLNPLMMWIWIGGGVLILGALITLLPNRSTVYADAPR
jgi:cytochrome c-type biogenesis protein CcmF